MDRYIAVIGVCIAAASGAAGWALGSRANELQEVGVIITMNQNYERRLSQFERIIEIEPKTERLVHLRRLHNSMADEIRFNHALTQQLFRDLDASIEENEFAIAQHEQELRRSEERQEAERQARDQSDREAQEIARREREEEERLARERDMREREEQARIAAERAAQRRAAEDRLIRDERICFDAACTNWIIP